MLKNLLLLSGFSTFVVIVIIALNIWHDISLSSLTTSTQTHVVAITPNFDKKTLNNLKKRVPLSINLQEKSNVVSEDSKETATITPSPTSTVTIGATSSATPTNKGL